jgi:hypothetical protein
LADTLQLVLTDDAEQAARDSGFVRRRRKLGGSAFVQTLVFGWLDNPAATLDDLTEVAADLEVEVTPQALEQRFTAPATQCLADVLASALHHAVSATPEAGPLLQRFAGVYVFDTSTVSLPASLATLFPGCGGTTAADGQAAVKIHVGLELASGALELSLGAGRQPDVTSVLARRPLPAGALRLADRGFFDMEVLQDYSDQEVFWITRLPCRLWVQPADGRRQLLADFLAAQPGDAVDSWVWMGQGQRLWARLLARRAPAAVVAKRLAQLQQRARDKGTKVSAAQRALCGWTVYLTNAPAEQLTWAEVWVLARARWVIELLFKLWKSHGGVDQTRGQKPHRVLCELYAKLLGQVVQHWILLTCGGPCVRSSHTKAARRVRRQAVRLVLVLARPAELTRLLERLRQRLQKGCQISPRQGRPALHQLLLEPDRAPVEAEHQSPATAVAHAA